MKTTSSCVVNSTPTHKFFAGTHARRKFTAKLPEASRRLMYEHIEKDYETLKQKTRYASWIQLQLTCDAQQTAAPSYKTLVSGS
jgi:hypothetical protein